MKQESVFLQVLLIILVTSSFAALEIQRVEASGTIYIRADGNVDPSTAPITRTDDFTYTLDDNISQVIVERDNIVIDGAFHWVGGLDMENALILSERSNVTVKNMQVWTTGHFVMGTYLAEPGIYVNNSVGIRLIGNYFIDNVFAAHITFSNDTVISANNISVNVTLVDTSQWEGIAMEYCSASVISDNNITKCGDGIILRSCTNNTIIGNTLNANKGSGVTLEYSSSLSSVLGNNITDNFFGILSRYSSNYNNISGNSMTGNDYGVYLYLSSGNIVSGSNLTSNFVGIWLGSSQNNVIRGNDVASSSFAIYLADSDHNMFYHNNFLFNNRQVYNDSQNVNVWDDGYPPGGNYWSDYKGTDANMDGLGDNPYIVDANDTDNYPLMGMFYSFNVSWVDSGYIVDLISNSTISGFDVGILSLEDPYTRFISFNVNGKNDTVGFCRILIPTALMDGTYRVLVNGTEVAFNLLPCSNSTHSYLYFNYTHSTQQVIIIAEFPSFLILPLFFMATLFAVTIYRRKQRTVR